MPRPLRNIVIGQPHHVVQRANNRETIFLDDLDHHTYIALWTRALATYPLSLWGFCLMSNHIHFILVPHCEGALNHAMQTVQSSYSRLFNARHGFTGHRWNHRYYAAPMGQNHRWFALAYVENNPVRANIVSRPDRYRWSSAPAHLLNQKPLLPLDSSAWHDLFSPNTWRDSLKRSAEKSLWIHRLRLATLSSLPFDDTTAGLLASNSKLNFVRHDVDHTPLYLYAS